MKKAVRDNARVHHSVRDFCATNKAENKFPNPEAEAFLENVCALSLLINKAEAAATWKTLKNNLSPNIGSAKSTEDFSGYYKPQWLEEPTKPWQNDFCTFGEDIRTDNALESYHKTLRAILFVNSDMWTFARI